LNSDDGIKASLIALKNNVSMKEKLIRIEADSDGEGKLCRQLF
jgi:hypothetical protein